MSDPNPRQNETQVVEMSVAAFAFNGLLAIAYRILIGFSYSVGILLAAKLAGVI